MTKERLVAEFEVGGMDAVWPEVESALEACRKAGFDGGYAKGERDWKDVSRRFDRFWTGVGQKAGAAFSVLVAALILGVIGGGIYAVAHYQVVKGGQELAACSRGQTFPCQAAMQNEYYHHDDGAKTDTPRGALYLTAYKQTTGHDLPPLDGVR